MPTIGLMGTHLDMTLNIKCMTGENTLQKVLGYKMADTNASQINLCNITNGNDARTLEIT